MTYRYSSSYKDQCRSEVYKVLDSVRRRRKAEGMAVVLAGPEAAEVPFLKDRFTAEQCLVVDRAEEEALSKASREFPGVSTFQEDIAAVVNRHKKICFANYDFCCGMRAEYVANAYLALEGKLSEGSVVAVTLHQRENFPDTPKAWNLQEKFLKEMANISKIRKHSRIIHTGQSVQSAMRTFVVEVIKA